ncbi:hypothetical protein BU16DRAFT_556500 [Lophium mytilinum]|uniref:Uncharacterized protein n=1 Tax=Lophium mytilinum TaxID=390894 RepID=A0A6A6R829_9PEZI|nr:hypothetical protein BU16DRAFT_556500 [Lophium mytilinum]
MPSNISQPFRTLRKLPEVWAIYLPEERRLAKLDALREICNELRRDASVQNWLDLELDWPNTNLAPDYYRWRVITNKTQFMAADMVQNVDDNGDTMDEITISILLRRIDRWTSQNESDREFQLEPCDIRVNFREVEWDQPATRIESPPVSPKSQRQPEELPRIECLHISGIETKDAGDVFSEDIEGHGKNETPSNSTNGRSRQNAVGSLDMFEAPKPQF